jgi:hypothetical protein
MNAHQRRIHDRAWLRRNFAGTGVAALPVVEMTLDELRKLREYSMSLPTGPKVGFRWRVNALVRRYGLWGTPKRWRYGLAGPQVLATVTDEPMGDGHRIRWERVQIVPGGAR